MKFLRITTFLFINIALLCVTAFAGNIINEGLFASHNEVVYYAENDDGGKLYADYNGYKTRLSDLNAKYINIYGDDIYFCSTDDTGEYAAISRYNIKSGKIFTLYAVEMIKGIKNLYVQGDIAYFQSDGKIYSFSLTTRKIESAAEDGEISDFIPVENGFVYTRIDDGKTPLYILSDGEKKKISDDSSAFDVYEGNVYYTCDQSESLNLYNTSLQKTKKLYDIKLSNLIVDNGSVYGKGSNDYTVYSYDLTKKELTSKDYDIYSFFNIVDGEIMSVYYSGALLSKTIIDVYSPASLTSYLPDVGEYKSWKQQDPRWANIKFPNGETVKQVGCLVTSISMLIVGSGVRSEGEFNPGTFVEALKNNNGFSGASLYWSAVERVVPEFKLYSSWTSLTGTKKEKANLIASHLEAGRKVVIRAVSNQHWVAADKVEDGKVYICDPARNVTDLFDYYDADDVTRIAIFHPVSSEAVKYESGLYSITSDNGLRLRSGPGLNYDRLSLIPFEEIVEITAVGDQWGYTTYKDIDGWVFMEYTKYIGPLSYTVKYDANGGLNPPSEQEKLHDKPLTLSMEQPQRNGYMFLGWSANPEATYASYSPGAIYSSNSGTTLYAVWQKSTFHNIYGDTDLNGVFDIADIIITAQHVADPENNPLSYAMFSAADINKDGKITNVDVEIMHINLAM